MTNTLHKKILKSSFSKMSYKLFILFYSFYMAFSSHAFALQAEAPLGTPSFKEVPAGIIIIPEEKVIDERAEKIRKYFNRYNLPLAEQAELFVVSADKYHIDWRLLAAIGFIESTGGKFACKSVKANAFGWGSCKLGFNSYKESIDFISMNLAGEYHKTSHHYKGKDVKGILEAYNPPSVIPDYARKVMREMDIITSM
jgi:hypothetical protein